MEATAEAYGVLKAIAQDNVVFETMRDVRPDLASALLKALEWETPKTPSMAGPAGLMFDAEGAGDLEEFGRWPEVLVFRGDRYVKSAYNSDTRSIHYRRAEGAAYATLWLEP